MITLEDFKLTPAEMAELVTGAQTFLPPAADPADDERLSQTDPLEEDLIAEP